jgi:signal transduction histidine kinase
MKLIKRTYIYTSFSLIPLLIFGSLFAFYMIEYIGYEETDEFLTYEMERLVKYHELNNDLPDFHKVADILEDVKYPEPVFKDTLLLEPGDNEMVPHRELRFSINHNGRDFTIVIRQILLGRDDIAQGTLMIIFGLLFLFSVFVVLTVNFAARKIWKPFYITLNKIMAYKIRDPLPVFKNSGIDEFNALNSTLQTFIKKISDDFLHNKQFNENASHELQTHLAVIKASTGKLLGNTGFTEEQLLELKKIHSAATKLSQAQKSLLLLSKIGNNEFGDNSNLNLAEVLKSSLSFFEETIGLRQIKLKKEIADCTVFMDAGLAEILVNNLIKNAVKHNVQNGFISAKLTNKELTIENSGADFKGNTDTLLQRFGKGENGYIGIGLAIVKEICELYDFKLDYTVSQGKHKISIRFNQK